MAPVEVNVCANEAEVISSLSKLIESKAQECLHKNNIFRVGLSGKEKNILKGNPFFIYLLIGNNSKSAA